MFRYGTGRFDATSARRPREDVGMTNRRGVTLAEVLVAAVLLAVGVGGALGALLTAAQLRTRASVREAVAAVVEARVGWFEAAGCGLPADSVVRATGRWRVEETWRVTRTGASVRLEGRATAMAGAHRVRRALVAARRCE